MSPGDGLVHVQFHERPAIGRTTTPRRRSVRMRVTSRAVIAIATATGFVLLLPGAALEHGATPRIDREGYRLPLIGGD
jgi:hypothetical protein